MFKRISASILMMVMIVCLTVSSAFAATENNNGYQDSSGNVKITGPSVPNSEFAFSGSNIDVNSFFDTTTFFAGNVVNLDGEYNGDVFVAGNIVTVNGKINGNLYAAGNQVSINGEVARDVFVGCSDLSVSKSANINRDLFIGSSNTDIEGTVGRNLHFGGENLTLNGTINGFVESDVEQLVINSAAIIAGEINNRSANEAVVSPSATAPAINWEKVTKEQTVEEDQGPGVGSILLSIITKLAFILVIWLLITFLTKEFNGNTKIMAKKHTLASLGLGAGFFFLAPFMMVISFIVYVPLGFAMTCLIIAGGILGMPVAAVVFSKLLTGYFNDKMKPLLSSFVSVLIVAAAVIILGFIPVVNFLVGLFMAVMGVGFIWYNVIFANRKLADEKSLSDEMLIIDKIINREEGGVEVTEVIEKEDKDDDIK